VRNHPVGARYSQHGIFERRKPQTQVAMGSARNVTHMKIHTSLRSLKTTIHAALLLAAGLFCSAPAFAKEIKLPNDEFAIASISIPGSWKPEAVEHGVEAVSDDGAIYMSVVAAGSEKGLEADIEATFEMLGEHKVKINEKTKKEGKGKINEFETTSLTFKGTDADGPCTIAIVFVPIKKKVLIMTFWFSDEEVEKHGKDMDKILGSLKAVAE
jgi:hypothetical protein